MLFCPLCAFKGRLSVFTLYITSGYTYAGFGVVDGRYAYGSDVFVCCCAERRCAISGLDTFSCFYAYRGCKVYGFAFSCTTLVSRYVIGFDVQSSVLEGDDDVLYMGFPNEVIRVRLIILARRVRINFPREVGHSCVFPMSLRFMYVWFLSIVRGN